jgi:crotonobetaine/carnitine-CoA ligase
MLVEDAGLGAVTLADVVALAAERWPVDPALNFPGEQRLSFAGLARRVGEARTTLARRGLAPGDRVALMMANSSAYCVAWLAATTAGAIAVPVNKRLGVRDCGFLLEHSRVAFAIQDPSATETLEAAISERGLASIELLPVSSLGQEGEWTAPYGGLHPRSLANIQYTSGTTGLPKGCLLTHQYWIRLAHGAALALSLGPEDRMLTAQSQSYMDPQWNLIAALLSGCELTVLDGFHPSTFMSDVARYATTVFYCLGVMPTLMLKQAPSALDRAHALRAVYCSAIPVDRHAEIESRWGVPWYEVFGMTESGVNTSVSVDDHDALVGSGSIGHALAHCEAAAASPDGTLLPPGEVGELLFRGLGMMEGYYDDPDATAAFFRNGWVHTGDLVRMDAAGAIFYVGRLKEIIRRAGENIAPAEIEEAVCAHPDVLECAVVPVPDPDVEEEVKAFVVLRPGAELTAEQLVAFLAGRLARFKVPRYVEFRDNLPRTPSEKIAKHLLTATSPPSTSD